MDDPNSSSTDEIEIGTTDRLNDRLLADALANRTDFDLVRLLSRAAITSIISTRGDHTLPEYLLSHLSDLQKANVRTIGISTSGALQLYFNARTNRDRAKALSALRQSDPVDVEYAKLISALNKIGISVINLDVNIYHFSNQDVVRAMENGRVLMLSDHASDPEHEDFIDRFTRDHSPGGSNILLDLQGVQCIGGVDSSSDVLNNLRPDKRFRAASEAAKLATQTFEIPINTLGKLNLQTAFPQIQTLLHLPQQ